MFEPFQHVFCIKLFSFPFSEQLNKQKRFRFTPLKTKPMIVIQKWIKKKEDWNVIQCLNHFSFSQSIQQIQAHAHTYTTKQYVYRSANASITNTTASNPSYSVSYWKSNKINKTNNAEISQVFHNSMGNDESQNGKIFK